MGPNALQIAKADGARVTGVDCAEKLPMLRALGADHVIDYRREDNLRNGEYIPIGHSNYDNRVNPIMGDIPKFVGLMLKSISNAEKRKSFKFPKKAEVLEAFRGLLGAGKLTPVIGKTFGLGEVVAAMKCMQQGQVGRVIITP